MFIEGVLAQLARAPRWQRGGHRFESGILHFYLFVPQIFFSYLPIIIVLFPIQLYFIFVD